MSTLTIRDSGETILGYFEALQWHEHVGLRPHQGDSLLVASLNGFFSSSWFQYTKKETLLTGG